MIYNVQPKKSPPRKLFFFRSICFHISKRCRCILVMTLQDKITWESEGTGNQYSKTYSIPTYTTTPFCCNVANLTLETPQNCALHCADQTSKEYFSSLCRAMCNFYMSCVTCRLKYGLWDAWIFMAGGRDLIQIFDEIGMKISSGGGIGIVTREWAGMGIKT